MLRYVSPVECTHVRFHITGRYKVGTLLAAYLEDTLYSVQDSVFGIRHPKPESVCFRIWGCQPGRDLRSLGRSWHFCVSGYRRSAKNSEPWCGLWFAGLFPFETVNIHSTPPALQHTNTPYLNVGLTVADYICIQLSPRKCSMQSSFYVPWTMLIQCVHSVQLRTMHDISPPGNGEVNRSRSSHSPEQLYSWQNTRVEIVNIK